jgi:hypothetical protein
LKKRIKRKELTRVAGSWRRRIREEGDDDDPVWELIKADI